MTPPRPLSTEARAQTRRLVQRLETESARIIAAAEAVPRAQMLAAFHKGATGAERAIGRITRAVPAPLLHREGRALMWRVLVPRPDLPMAIGQPVEAIPRPCLVVEAITVGWDGRPAYSRQTFGLAVTLHTVGRFFDRAPRGSDPVEAILGAHNVLLGLQIEHGHEVMSRGRLTLPAGDGAVLCSTRVTAGGLPLVVGSTWLSTGQLHLDQDAEVAEWSTSLSEAAVSA